MLAGADLAIICHMLTDYTGSLAGVAQASRRTREKERMKMQSVALLLDLRN